MIYKKPYLVVFNLSRNAITNAQDSFLLFKRKSKTGKSKKDIKKVPKVFYHPTKIKTYVAFERNEIY